MDGENVKIKFSIKTESLEYYNIHSKDLVPLRRAVLFDNLSPPRGLSINVQLNIHIWFSAEQGWSIGDLRMRNYNSEIHFNLPVP